MQQTDHLFLRERAKNLSIYEVNLRQFSHEGSIREFAAHLPRLRDLGVGILWIMPIHPIGVLNRKGSLGSYYSVKDFLAVDPHYGSLEDFRELVKEIHRLGMYVILDWVANHTSWDNNLTREKPEYFDSDEAGRFKPPFPEWEDVIHLNYSNPGLREYMTRAMKFWVREADIDGYRCDMANLVPADFWKEAIDELRRTKPVFMLAEADQRELLDAGFDVLYNWRIYHLMNEIGLGKKGATDIDLLLESEFYSFPAACGQLLFTSNHDENSWNGSESERLGNSSRVCAILTYTLPGIPLIYTGQEVGMRKRLPFFDKDVVDWQSDGSLAAFYQKLNALRQRNSALWTGVPGSSMKRLPNSAHRSVLSFIRERNGNKVLVMANLSATVQTFNMDTYSFSGDYTDTFSGKRTSLAQQASFTLSPWDFHIFEK